MAFDLKKHVIRVQGNREYLPVAARLVWFRMEHPDWSIVTTPVEINLEKQYAIFSASIMNTEGRVMATGTKMENVKGFGDYLEKSETGSVGRALAMCGYGTQFAPEFEEGGRFADAPQGPNTAPNRFAARPNGVGNLANRPAIRPAPMNNGGNGSMGNNANNGNNNGNMGGNSGGGNPMNGGQREAPRPPMPMTAAPGDDGSPFDGFGGDDRAFEPAARERNAPPAQRSEAPTIRSEMPAPRPAAPAPRAEASTPRPEAAPGGVTRVREPDRDYSDPGGSDEPEDPDDPFGDEQAHAPKATEPLPPIPSLPITPTKPNPLADAPRCSIPGCLTPTITAGQATLSTQKAGRPLCNLHLREAMSSAGAKPGNPL